MKDDLEDDFPSHNLDNVLTFKDFFLTAWHLVVLGDDLDLLAFSLVSLPSHIMDFSLTLPTANSLARLTFLFRDDLLTSSMTTESGILMVSPLAVLAVTLTLKSWR